MALYAMISRPIVPARRQNHVTQAESTAPSGDLVASVAL